MPSEVKILTVSKMPSADPARRGEAVTWVVYQVTGGRSATVMIPKAAPTEADITAAIAAEEKQRSALIGKTLKIP